MPLPTVDQFYSQLDHAFTRACETGAQHAGPPTSSLLLAIGPFLARVRCTSWALHERLRRPLAHLQVLASQRLPDFTIDLIDGRASACEDLALPWPAQRISPEQDTCEYQDGPYLFTLHGNVVLTGVHYPTNRTVGCVRDPLDWPLEHYKQAIFITFYQHLRRRGLHLVHASAIGRNGKVMLIAGSSGAGKTTTMLTCVRAGFEFLGDDTTLVQSAPGDGVQAVSLLNTVNVTDQTLAWFPELVPHLSDKTNLKGKRLALVDDVYPGCVALNGTVGLILVPEVTSQARTTVQPASKAALLSAMLPYSLDLQDAAMAREHLEFLARLLETHPSYRLLLGQDRERLPQLLGQLL